MSKGKFWFGRIKDSRVEDGKIHLDIEIYRWASPLLFVLGTYEAIRDYAVSRRVRDTV